MDKESLEKLISYASDKDFVQFKDTVIDLVQQKVDDHPGVQAYRDDINHYQEISNTMNQFKDNDENSEEIEDDEDDKDKDSEEIEEIEEIENDEDDKDKDSEEIEDDED